jgi:uncharacterized membrane protein YGL010W
LLEGLREDISIIRKSIDGEEDGMPSLTQYMAQYDHEHTNPWNKVMHAIGIPIVIAGTILMLITWWRIGLALFIGGWILLFAGHRIEGNKPAFFQGVIYFLVGPIWIAKELKDALFGTSHRSTTAH